MQMAQSDDSLAQKPKHFSASEVHLRTPLIAETFPPPTSGGCLRVGEANQLKWGDILSFERHMLESEYEDKQKENVLVEIRVRWETSKVRKNRTFFCRGGQYFQRLKERQQFTNDEDLIFSMTII
jgi:hypothetical protein